MPRRTVTNQGEGMGSSFPIVRSSTFVVAASDAPTHMQFQADFVCDGVADEVELSDALAGLPAEGGKIALTQGTFTFSAQLTLPVKNNITIEGQGRGTRINYNATNNVILSGGSGGAQGVVLQYFDTDAGGVTILGSANSILRYWKNGVWTEHNTTPGVSQSRQLWFKWDALTTIDFDFLPARSMVTGVHIYVYQAFNDGVSNLLSVGGMWGAGIELDAYSKDIDVGSVGAKSLLAGDRLGVPSVVNNLAWVTYSGTVPTAGLALIQIDFTVCPVAP